MGTLMTTRFQREQQRRARGPGMLGEGKGWLHCLVTGEPFTEAQGGSQGI